jgi:hypothetical protein
VVDVRFMAFDLTTPDQGGDGVVLFVAGDGPAYFCDLADEVVG